MFHSCHRVEYSCLGFGVADAFDRYSFLLDQLLHVEIQVACGYRFELFVGLESSLEVVLPLERKGFVVPVWLIRSTDSSCRDTTQTHRFDERSKRHVGSARGASFSLFGYLIEGLMHLSSRW